MSFRDDTQRGRVCAALTSWIRGAPLWTPDAAGIPRPTDLALAIDEDGEGRSTSEITMVRIALVFWNGRDDARGTFASMLYSLDRNKLAMLGALLIAVAARQPHAVDIWLAQHEVQP